jgi:UDP-GlcNAc:undecaprenyl-phosphate/decaprenyl-phosphate GlcNAc-1-phosphate transferase
MYSLIVLIFASFAIALVATPLLRDLFRHWGVVDVPDGKRKIHSKPIPRMGGVPIITACLGAHGLLMLSPLGGGSMERAALPAVGALLPAVALVFAIGLWDDIRGLQPWQKLVGELAASVLALLGGVHMGAVAGLSLPQWVTVLGTLLWLIACTNAINLIDGVDGLAAGIVLFAAITTFIAGLLQGNMALAFAVAPLMGALLAFLRYNFNPASIFLGDSGSLTLGFLLGCYSILWSQKAATIFSITAPLLMLAVPLLDAGLAIVRRFLRQQPVFAADRGHIHHRLLARGLTTRRVVLLLYAVAGACAGLSLLLGPLQHRFAGPVLVVFVVGVCCGINYLGYVEFGTARRLLIQGAFRRLLNAHISLDAVANKVQAARSVEECWRHVSSSYHTFGFTSVELQVAGRAFRHPLEPADGQTGWKVSVDLQHGNYVVLRRNAGMQNHITLAAAFAEMLEKTLPTKLVEFRKREQAGHDEARTTAMSAGGLS